MKKIQDEKGKETGLLLTTIVHYLVFFLFSLLLSLSISELAFSATCLHPARANKCSGAGPNGRSSKTCLQKEN